MSLDFVLDCKTSRHENLERGHDHVHLFNVNFGLIYGGIP